MKNLVTTIWNAPATKLAGALTGSLSIVIASDIDISKIVIVGLLSVSTFLSFFASTPKK